MERLSAGGCRVRASTGLKCPLLLLCALWVPFRLLDWVPHMGSFAMEMVSFVVRLLVAYLLFVAAWLLLAFFTSGG